jgi:hypothetical protein
MSNRPPSRIEFLQGTLDILILRTLLPGTQHGHAIAKHIQRTSEDLLQVETGSLYLTGRDSPPRGARSMEQGKKTPVMLIVLAWLFVGLPWAWGVVQFWKMVESSSNLRRQQICPLPIAVHPRPRTAGSQGAKCAFDEAASQCVSRALCCRSWINML